MELWQILLLAFLLASCCILLLLTYSTIKDLKKANQKLSSDLNEIKNSSAQIVTNAEKSIDQALQKLLKNAEESQDKREKSAKALVAEHLIPRLKEYEKSREVDDLQNKLRDLSTLQRDNTPGEIIGLIRRIKEKSEENSFITIDVSGYYLKEAVFADSSGYDDIILKDCILDGADFRSNSFCRSVFDGLDLSSVDLHDAKLEEATFVGAILNDTNLQGAKAMKASFENAKMKKAQLQNAQLNGANFRNADLQGADLRGADLREADLRGADLKGAILHHTKLEQVKFLRSKPASRRVCQ